MNQENQREENREQFIQEVDNKLNELNQIQKTESLVQYNMNEFEYKEKLYRVRLLKPIEKDEVNKERGKLWSRLLKDPDYILRKSMVADYKEKGIDIDQMDVDYKNLYLKEQELLERLGKTTNLKDIEVLRREILIARQEQKELFYEKDKLLKYCIETQVEDFTRLYMIYLVLEEKNGESWMRVFKSFKEFNEYEDELLSVQAAQLLSVMLYVDEIK